METKKEYKWKERAKELQKPTARQDYEYGGEMHKIETEEAELLVSPEHKVYGKIEEKSIANNSFVENILTLFCFLNPLSSDQIPELEAKANAKYSTSFECGANFSASEAYLLNPSNGTGLTCFFMNENNSASSSLSSLLLDNISSKCLPTSKNKNSGAINSNFLTKELIKNTSKTFLLDNNAEKTLLASTTMSILNYLFKDCSNLFANDSSILSDNSSTSFSVNFDLATILFSLASFSNSPSTSLVITNDASILGNLFISSSNSLGTLNLNSILYKDCGLLYKTFYSHLEDFNLIKIVYAYDILKEGKQLYFLDSENKPVRAKSITKQQYSGKIYDVDAPDDVVLARTDKVPPGEGAVTKSSQLVFTGWYARET